jgi:hypothetical protein
VGGSKPFVTIPTGALSTSKFVEYSLSGTYVKEYGSASIYVVAGGSAIPVPGWSTVGGSKPFVTIPTGALSTSKFVEYPLDYTYVKEYGSGTIYVTAGGAALGISNWSNVGGAKPYVIIPSNSIATNLREYPLDGTVIRTYTSGGIYVVAGNAALAVANMNNIPYTSWVDIDSWALSNQFAEVPVDGTLVKGYISGEVFQVTNGIAVADPESASTPVFVDDWAIDNQLFAVRE